MPNGPHDAAIAEYPTGLLRTTKHWFLYRNFQSYSLRFKNAGYSAIKRTPSLVLLSTS